MKKLSKILILVLSLAILCGALVIAISANGTDYDLEASIDEAVADGSGMKTVKLTGNATLADPYTVEENLTIDLGGYTFTSNLETAFIVKSDVTFQIVGNGNLNLSGMIVRADATAENPTIAIEGSGSGIDVYHSGSDSESIISMYSGTARFVNLDVLSEVSTTAQYKALFNTVYTTEGKVDITFENTAVKIEECGTNLFFLVSAAGVGSHLTMKDSSFMTDGSGFFLGHMMAEDGSTETEIVSFENSALYIQKEYETQTKWGFFLEGYKWAQTGVVGTVNIKDSFVEVAGRPFYSSYEKSDNIVTSVINLENTEAKSIGANGSKHDELFARFVIINADKDSKISGFNKNTELCFNEYTKVSVQVGTRVSDLAAVKNTSKGVTYPDGSIGESGNYDWLYDPASDPLYPYVLVEKSAMPADAPYYHVDYTFEMMNSTPASDGADNIFFLDKTSKSYVDNESFKDNSKGMQFDIKGGSLQRATVHGNSYVKFVATVNSQGGTHSVSADGATISYGIDPYFILGGHMNYATNKAHVANEGGHTRAKVAVLNFDFGTDSDAGYPVLVVASQARRTSSGSNAVTGDIFRITPDGDMENIAMRDFNTELALNPTGEWNHMTVVYYTDPALNGNKGAAHFYLNGEYLGHYDAYGNADQSYIMGTRFNVARSASHNIDASICIDNVSLSAYSEYLYEGEKDAANGADGIYLHSNYVTDSPANKYMTPAYTAGGFVVNSEIDDALEIANGLGKDVVLIRDTKSPHLVSKDGTIFTNGHEFNLDPASISAIITYDENGVPVKYDFNSLYDAYGVNYYWYTGEYGNVSQMKDSQYYDKTVVGIGQIPEALKEVSPYVAESASVFKRFLGWSTSPESKTADEFVPVTISLAVTQGDKPIYVYPIYEEVEVDFNAYIVKSDKSVSGISYSDAETTALYKSLKNDETLVLLSDFTQTAANVKFDNPNVDHGVEIDNDYTDEELETMKDASVKIAVDLNGFNWYLSAAGSVAWVSRNTTLTVYSSRPDAYIYSRGSAWNNDTSKYQLKGQRMFAIYGGTEKAVEKTNVYNAHIELGTATVGGVTYPGSNLTLNGGVILEGLVGDNSCSIEANNILAMRGAPDSSGMIMTRYYDGEIIVKDSIFVGAVSAKLIDLKGYYKTQSDSASGRDSSVGDMLMTPYVLLENSLFINSSNAATGTANDIVENNGDDVSGVCLEYKNFITNGKLNQSNIPGRNYVGGGVGAYNFAVAANSPYEKAYYNQQMTLNMKGTYADADSHMIRMQYPQIDTATGAINDDRYFYVVDMGYEYLVPADAAGYIVLPIIEKLSGAKNDAENPIYTVRIFNFQNKVLQTMKFVKGGTPVDISKSIIDIPSVQISDLVTIVHNGKYNEDLTAGISSNASLHPTYDIVIDGVKTNLTIGPDFGLNILVPAAYASLITEVSSSVTDGALTGVTKNVDGTDYIVYTVSVPAGKMAEDVVFGIGITDSSNATYGTVSGNAIINANVTDYLETILANASAEFTAADRMMAWYVTNYANEAYKYFGGAENEALATLLATYADANANAAEREYSDVLESTGLSAVFSYATVKLAAVPTYSFVVKAGFAGNVSVVTSAGTYSFAVEKSETFTTLLVEGLKAYELAETVTIIVSGTIGDEAVEITDGQFNLATYANYHSQNAYAGNDSALALDMINALYDYVEAAAKFKDGTLAAVPAPEEPAPEEPAPAE